MVPYVLLFRLVGFFRRSGHIWLVRWTGIESVTVRSLLQTVNANTGQKASIESSSTFYRSLFHPFAQIHTGQGFVCPCAIVNLR